ncbi:hypothetical protein COUCH_22070 [Couchioplanes caeruleus]|uniref:hypothetical protein n=1 Tax=Couchioplanes caeruleus TaxID=56438 RepID=UPI0020C0B319|nr:hypothetical protein [Couchioplanes caeruleus]UQU61728.1 hypothetical protein COUCH_22070 [Couchioplanes caeruleus]
MARSADAGRPWVADAAADLARQTGATVAVTRTVLPGRRLHRILQFADEVRADLIVAGSGTRPWRSGCRAACRST